MGCNFFSLKQSCRNHTDAYKGLKVAPGYLAHAGPDSTRDKLAYWCYREVVGISIGYYVNMEKRNTIPDASALGFLQKRDW